MKNWHFGSRPKDIERYKTPRSFIGRYFGFEGKDFVAYFYAVNWFYFSLGFHIDFRTPNFEIHLPIGFLRIGFQP